MATISKKSAKKLRARERHNAKHEISNHVVSTPPPPTQLSKFPDINVQQEATNHYGSYPAPTRVTEPPTATLPAPTEEDMNTVRKIDAQLAYMEQNWAETQSGPFPEGIRNAIADLRASLEKRDTDAAPASEPPDLAGDVRNVTAAHMTASPTVITNSPTTATIVSNMPTTADCSLNQTGTNITTAIPELPAVPTAAPSTSSDGYTTAQPEQLYSLLTAAPSTVTNRTADPSETVPNPADYSLGDIEEVLLRIRKRHGRTGIPVPGSVQETAETLR